MIHCYITDNLRSHMIDSAPSLKKKREKKEDHFKYKSHKSAK